MYQNTLYSIRMRASAGGRHVSGAEGIVPSERVEVAFHALVSRALGKASMPDEIVLSVESLEGVPIRTLRALDVITQGVQDTLTGRAAAKAVLMKAGVSRKAAEAAIDSLSRGPGPSGNTMRGAMIVDALTGERLEPDRERGVRASRFDWIDEARTRMDQELAAAGLTHPRTREALALATKAAHAPGMVAELCWSDDPDYRAGYAASAVLGYVRFPFLKDEGDPKGGRVYFVSREQFDRDAFLDYLQNEAVLIVRAGKCRGERGSETLPGLEKRGAV